MNFYQRETQVHRSSANSVLVGRQPGYTSLLEVRRSRTCVLFGPAFKTCTCSWCVRLRRKAAAQLLEAELCRTGVSGITFVCDPNTGFYYELRTKLQVAAGQENTSLAWSAKWEDK